MANKALDTKVQSELSIERTVLANRRTLMAYMRSAVALVVAGAGLMKFIQDPVWVVIGIIFVALTPFVIALGIYDYFHVKKLIDKETNILQDHLETGNAPIEETDEN